MRSRARLVVRRSNAPKVARRKPVHPSPIVKWVGGKTKLLDELIARKPARYRRYFEPFFGGGALFFRLSPKTAVISDRNPDLINTYRCIAWNVEAVIRRLSRHRRLHNSEYYYETRARWNDVSRKRVDVERAATFIYLNKTCYNGLWRVNRKGEFNVPVGRYNEPSIYHPAHLREVSKVLQRCDLRSGHFADGVADAAKGDFVYFDPPYHPVSDTANFTSYTAGSFNAESQQELATVARDLVNRGCHVMLSNSDTPFIRKIYRGWKIDQVMCARAINSKASKRGAVAEVVITNR